MSQMDVLTELEGAQERAFELAKITKTTDWWKRSAVAREQAGHAASIGTVSSLIHAGNPRGSGPVECSHAPRRNTT